MTRDLIRTWHHTPFTLRLWDTGRTDWRGQSRLAYEFKHKHTVIFQGEDFAGSPLHADDSDATLGALLSFLSLRPGDTDAEYFNKYTAEQLAFASEHGEELSYLALCLEEKTS